MRLGFVGVGKHAQRMAAAFRECGAEIVCFDRGTGDPRDLVRDPLFGSRMPWASQVLAPDVDAIICCAPPAVTAEIAADCLIVNKRCCATKPLKWPLLNDSEIADCAGCIYVDLWRLYSPAWLALKADVQGREIRSVHVDFYGSGPVRETHSGLLDYGPHALAFVLDLGLRPELRWEHRVEFGMPNSKAPYWFGESERVHICTGNESDAPAMEVLIETTDGKEFRWIEQDALQLCQSVLWCHRDLALRNFCRAFLAGEPNDTLRISCEAMKLLRQAEPW